MANLVNTIKADGATALWTLDDASGTAARDAVGTNHGTISGSVALAQGPILGGLPRCMDFSGGSITVPDSATFTPHLGAAGVMSLEMVLQMDTLPAVAYYPISKATTAYEFGFSVSPTGAITFALWDGTSSGVLRMSATSANVSTGVPLHVLGTYNRATPLCVIYVNGAAVSSSALPNGGTTADTTSTITLGTRGDGYGNPLDGRLGLGAYYPTELSPTKAAKHYKEFLGSGVTY